MRRKKKQNNYDRQPNLDFIPDTPQNNQVPHKKKIMRPFEWAMIIMCVVIVAVVALHEGGFPLVKKTESVEIVERPIESRKKATPVRYRDADIDRNVDEVLKDIAKEFSDEGKGKKRVSKKDLRQKGLDRQEADYLNQVKKEQKEKGTLESARDWYNVLKASHATYSKVKNVFGGVNGDTESMIDRNTISTILDNDILSNSVFSELERKFNIPKEQSEAFAKAGKKQLDDWADFVEENKAN